MKDLLVLSYLIGMATTASLWWMHNKFGLRSLIWGVIFGVVWPITQCIVVMASCVQMYKERR